MLEESIWASMNSWFTPTVLFVLLNVVIGTIAITSKKHKDHHQQQQQQQQEPLNRAPSLLYRLKSIDFYRYRSEAPNPGQVPDPVPDPPSQQESESDDEYHEEEHHQQHQATRSVSDTKPASGEVPVKLAKKIRKSASVKSAFAHFEEDREAEERRRPATVREAVKKRSEDLIDEEVDAKADDFINRFKQQLKLQRLDSLIRYKEMITRGGTQ